MWYHVDSGARRACEAIPSLHIAFAYTDGTLWDLPLLPDFVCKAAPRVSAVRAEGKPG